MKDLLKVTDWLAAVGIALLSAGLVIGSAFTGWTTLPIVLLSLGGVALLGWGLTHQMAVATFFGLRSTQSSVNVLFSVIAVVVILGLLNYLGARFEYKFDLTKEGLYTLSPQTVKVVQGLTQPIKVWAVATVPDNSLREQLERFQRVNPDKFQFEFVNPRNAPEQAKRLDVTQDNTLVVEAGSRKQKLVSIIPSELESSLTPAISKVLNTQSLTAYFIEGHGELPTAAAPGVPGLAKVVKGLSEESYTDKTINLVEADIPADAAAVIVAGPQKAFFPGEVEKLKAYGQKGGKLLLMFNPPNPKDPEASVGLEPLLEDWGVKLDTNVVVDVSQVSQLLGTGPSVALITTYGSHPITTDLANQRLMTLFPLARSLETIPKDGIQVTQLLLTSPQSWGETDPLTETSKIKFDDKKDKQGPLNIGLALTRKAEGVSTPAPTASPAAATDPQSRMVVIGNANFAIDANFNQQGNGDLFLNSVNWLTERTDQISIRPKSITNRRFSLTQQNLYGLAFLSMLGLPVLALGTGGFLWWRRR